MRTKLPILLSFLLPLLLAPASVSSQFHELSWFCMPDQGDYTTNSTYQNNLNPLFAYLTDQASHATFGNYSVGEGTNKANMIYNCRGDLGAKECHDCIQLATQRIVTVCPTQRESIFWFQECMIRYSNRNLYSIEEERPSVWDYSNGNVSNPLPYDKVVVETLDGLIMEAAYNQSKNGYVIGEGNASGLVEGNKVHCLVQCTPDILGSRCERCLRAALRGVAGCCGLSRLSVQFYYPSCQIYYSPVAFIRGTTSSPALSASPPSEQAPSSVKAPPKTGGSMSRMIKADGGIVIFGLIVAVSVLFIMPSSI